jgi:hypothetical protein
VSSDWEAVVTREEERYRDGEARLPGIDDVDQRQRQLTRMGNAAYGAGLAHLMTGDRGAAADWLGRAAGRYRESLDGAPAGSWGRYIACLKARILVAAWAEAEHEASRALEAGAADSESPIGRYAAALASLVLGKDAVARRLADELRIHGDFPTEVGDALAMLAAGTDRIGYIEAVEAVLETFENRDEYLEEVPVADTVLVLQALAQRRGLAADLTSPLLPA